RFLTPAAGVSLLQALDIYSRSIQASVTATKNAAELLAQYNTALARLEESKGTLLDEHGIYIYGDPCTEVQRSCIRQAKWSEIVEEVEPGKPVPTGPQSVPVTPALPPISPDAAQAPPVAPP